MRGVGAHEADEFVEQVPGVEGGGERFVDGQGQGPVGGSAARAAAHQRCVAQEERLSGRVQHRLPQVSGAAVGVGVEVDRPGVRGGQGAGLPASALFTEDGSQGRVPALEFGEGGAQGFGLGGGPSTTVATAALWSPEEPCRTRS